jgi:hypothetical protein
MSKGSHDDRSAEEINRAVEDALAQLRLAEFRDAVVRCEVGLVIAMALDDEPPT